MCEPQEAFLTSCIEPLDVVGEHGGFGHGQKLRKGDLYNVVVVGAGFDTGALRRHWPPGLQGYYEVEFPAVPLQQSDGISRPCLHWASVYRMSSQANSESFFGPY